MWLDEEPGSARLVRSRVFGKLKEMNILDEFYVGLTKKERRELRRKEKEESLAAIRRNKILRRVFFWAISILVILTSGWLLLKIAG